MRFVIFGTTGSGKSTFAQKLAQARAIPFIELDLINWRPNWVGRNNSDPEGFAADVQMAIKAESWVATGAYGGVRSSLWSRATDLVFLDLPRHIVMTQVIKRSFKRVASKEDVFPGCKETWRAMLDPEHPIPWAWTTYHKRRQTFEKLTSEPAFSHLRVHRCKSRQEVATKLEQLSQ
jgi:adenylate kinase family enzyme